MTFRRYCGKQEVIFAGLCHIERGRVRWIFWSVFHQSSVVLAISARRLLNQSLKYDAVQGPEVDMTPFADFD